MSVHVSLSAVKGKPWGRMMLCSGRVFRGFSKGKRKEAREK